MVRDGLDGVVRFIRLNKLTKWVVRDGNGQNDYVFKSGDADQETNIKLMLDVLDGISSGRLIISGTPNENNKTGWYTQSFSVGVEQPASTHPSYPAVGMITSDEVDRRIAEAREQWNREQEMERLREELKDAKEEINSLRTPINDVVRRLAPIVQPAVGAILQRLGGAPVQAATTPANIGVLDKQPETVNPEEAEAVNPEEEYTSPEEDEVLSLFAEWKKADPDCLSLYKAIATIGIKQCPVMNMDYATVKQMIINFANQNQ